MFLIQEILRSFLLRENRFQNQQRSGDEDRENDSYDPEIIKLLDLGSFFHSSFRHITFHLLIQKIHLKILNLPGS